MSEQNKWSRPSAPPNGMFLNQKERDLVKQVNVELLSRVLPQTIGYYAIDHERTEFNIYGEAIMKNFLPPLRVHARVFWEGTMEQPDSSFGSDKKQNVDVWFHKRRLNDDQNLEVRIGDFVQYGSSFYEITSLEMPRHLFGNVDFEFEVKARGVKARKGLFDGL
jgi:hypothetical protein